MSVRGIPLPPSAPTAESLPPGVYVLPRLELGKYAPPWFVDGRPVRALAAHPQRPDLIYLTTEHPAKLASVAESYAEVG